MAKPVLLMLLSRHPYAEQSGRASMLRQRIEQARLEFEVRLAVFGAPAGDPSDQGIEFLPMAAPVSVALNAVRLWRRPFQTWLYHSEAVRERIADLAAESRVVGVYVDMLRLATLAERLPRNKALIVDYDDLLSQRYAAAAGKNYEAMGFLTARVGLLAPAARMAARPLLRAEAKSCAAFEQKMLGRADLVLFTSPREAASAAARREGAYVMGAPPLVACFGAVGPPGDRLIFLGNLRYAENIIMLRALAVAAAAYGAAPEWVIEAVGEHAPDLPAQFDARRFRFLGRVQDLGVLAGAGIFLAPVTGGSGVKLKILDGMALGCPVVATTKACEGLSARANRDLVVAADAAAVLRAALALRGRLRLKTMLAQRGRAYVERAHAPSIGVGVAQAMLAAVARARQETL